MFMMMMTNTSYSWKLIGTRIRGRTRKRWVVDIEEDMQIMGIRRWRNQCKERAEWKTRLKPIVGCNAKEEEEEYQLFAPRDYQVPMYYSKPFCRSE
jgi:hypothetical protein